MTSFLINQFKCLWSLTEKRVAEAVPAAPVGPGQPPAAHAGREAEGSPEEADEHVARADVDEQQVDRSPEPGEAGEHDQHQEVPEETEDQDEPEGHSRHGVTRPAQGGAVPGADVVAMLQDGHHGNLVVSPESLELQADGGFW